MSRLAGEWRQGLQVRDPKRLCFGGAGGFFVFVQLHYILFDASLGEK